MIKEAEVCFIDIRAYRDLLNSSPYFSYEIMIELCINELDVLHRCANRTQKQVRQKIADVILEFPGRINNSESFVLPLTQKDIGNLVDSSRDSVSRAMTEFEKDGILRFAGKRIEIINRKSLMMISANE